MELKPEYKQTEVGLIPEAWEVSKIGELCDYQNGTSLERLFNHNDGLKVISIGNYSVTGGYIDNGVYISLKHRKIVEKFILRQYDLTMSLNDKTSVGAIIGRVLLIEQDDLFVFNQRTMRLRPKKDVFPAYLHYVINADRAHGALVGLAKPGTQIYINTDDVINLRLPVPPLPEQRAIAGALGDMDALLSALDQLIAKKRDLKQATIQQLLTGQTRLPAFRDEWKTTRLGKLAQLYQPETIGQSVFTEDGYPVYGANGIIGRYDRYNHSTSQITISCRGNCGTVNRTEQFSWITGNAMVINFDQNKSVNFEFMFHLLRSQDFSVLVTGSGQPQIVRGPLAAFQIRLPSDPNEQAAIAAVLSDMDAELAALEQRRDKTRALKHGMMQELLTGRTRLV